MTIGGIGMKTPRISIEPAVPDSVGRGMDRTLAMRCVCCVCCDALRALRPKHERLRELRHPERNMGEEVRHPRPGDAVAANALKGIYTLILCAHESAYM